MTKNKMEKITFDEHGRWMGCPNEPICQHDCNSSCPQYPVKPAHNSIVGSIQIVQQLGQDKSSEEILRLWKEGKLWIRTDGIRKCAECGKIITGGYVWDGTDTFCSEDCAAKVFDGDYGCVDILIDEGRLVWQDEF